MVCFDMDVWDVELRMGAGQCVCGRRGVKGGVEGALGEEEGRGGVWVCVVVRMGQGAGQKSGRFPLWERYRYRTEWMQRKGGRKGT